jgi:hypothetical protein
LKPDDISIAYAKKKNRKKVTVKIDDEGGMVIIEGEAEALEFVGNLLLAQAKYEKDCSYFISPRNPGGIFFNNKKSTHGIYIHRLPCLEK